MKPKLLLIGTAVAALVAAMGAQAQASELHFTCYQDGVECDTWAKLFKDFEAKNPGTTVKVDIVPYQAILQSLPVQLAGGEGPDLARVTDLGGLAKYMLNIKPLIKDAAYWEDNYGPTLNWTRVHGPNDNGIYSLNDQLSVNGSFVNKTLFDQAGVKMPKAGATWDDWAKATSEVAKKTGTPYPMAMDRSGHRFAGLAISYGAKYFDKNGNPITVDAGFKAFAKQFVKWNQDGVMDKEVWAGSGGSTYQDATKQFINAKVVMYVSGSWQVGRFGKDIGDAFDWVVAPEPCGPAACTGIPGGAAVVGFKQTKHPEEVAKLLDYMAQKDVMAKFDAATNNIPPNKSLQQEGIDYTNASAPQKAALKQFATNLLKFSPIAFEFQGYKNNRAIMNATVTRITQAIVGESTLDEALARINSDVKEAVAAAK